MSKEQNSFGFTKKQIRNVRFLLFFRKIKDSIWNFFDGLWFKLFRIKTSRYYDMKNKKWKVSREKVSYTKEEKLRIKENKKLCKKYPFLKFNYNLWSGKIDPCYDYLYTWYDEIPEGWKKAFGQRLLDDYYNVLKKTNYLHKFRFEQIKEKYGTLRLYSGPAPEEIFSLESKYEDLSMLYCINCGKPTKYITSGWIEYLCEDCYKKCNPDLVEGSEEEIEAKLTKKDIPYRVHYGKNNKKVKIKSLVEDEFKKYWKK